MPMPTKEEQRDYQRQWIAKRRADWIAKNGPCARCGSKDRMEVDHVDPKKKRFHASNMWSWSKKRRDAELKKCQVLCHKHHLEKSIEEGSVLPKTHGTRNRYRAGCRCSKCRAWNAGRVRIARERKKNASTK